MQDPLQPSHNCKYDNFLLRDSESYPKQSAAGGHQIQSQGERMQASTVDQQLLYFISTRLLLTKLNTYRLHIRIRMR